MQKRPSKVNELEECLSGQKPFWFWGRKGCGKSYRLGQATQEIPAVVVELIDEMSGEEWAQALNEALPDADRVGWDGEVEEYWRRWCRRVAKEDRFFVIDDWEGMPEALVRGGVEVAREEGAKMGFVARQGAEKILGAGGAAGLEEIECPRLSRDEEQALVRAELVWRGGLELEGEYWELVGESGTGYPLQAMTILAGLASGGVSTRDKWVDLERVWARYQARFGDAVPGFADPVAVQEVLKAASWAAESGMDDEKEREFLKEVFEGVDGQFRLLLTRPRVGPALEALERVPGRLRGSMPLVRFRLGQCLKTVGRKREADRIFRGLSRMKNSRAGQYAYVLIQHFAGYEGRGDEAVEALLQFLEERVEPGEEFDAVVRLVLGRLLVGRGAYRQSQSIVQEGIRSARASGALWELHLLRSHHGMYLAFAGEPESGMALMHDAAAKLEELGLDIPLMEVLHHVGTVYFEREEYEQAREALRRARPYHKAHGEELNLRLVDIMEQIIAMILGEVELPTEELEKTPVEWEWPYYQAELSFAEGLWAVRRGERELALQKFERALRLHLDQGTVAVVVRILRHYLPVVLAGRSVDEARRLLALLAREHLAERDCAGIVEPLIEAVWLSGSFGAWGLVKAARGGEVVEFGSGESLFPARGNHEVSEEVGAWVDAWDAVLCGEDVGVLGGPAALTSLHAAWAAHRGGNEKRSRRLLSGAREGEFSGGVFGFLRGLLEAEFVEGEGPKQPRGRAEILSFWHLLPTEVVVQQLQFWEARLEQGLELFSPTLAENLRAWLEVVQRWRVDGAMLLDEARGEVFFEGQRFNLGRDTVGFDVLCALANRQQREEITAVDDLFEEVWQRPYAPPSSTNSVYVTVATLRQELGGSEGEMLIRNRRSGGYALEVPVVFAPK